MATQYEIVRIVNIDDDGKEEHEVLEQNVEFLGSKPIRKHYQSAIRALLDYHDNVQITISNNHESRDFLIIKREDES